MYVCVEREREKGEKEKEIEVKTVKKAVQDKRWKLFTILLRSSLPQSMVCLEEKCGYTFHHISLLTRAFTHSSHQDTRLTK